VTFDPFGDFATRGYLRNLANAKDPDIVRRLQHNSFMTGLDQALANLAGQKRLATAMSLARIKFCLRQYSRGRAKIASPTHRTSSSAKDRSCSPIRWISAVRSTTRSNTDRTGHSWLHSWAK
jgi:hypothetical protein